MVPFSGDMCLFFVGGGGVDATNSLFRFSFVFVYTWIFSIDTLLDGYVLNYVYIYFYIQYPYRFTHKIYLAAVHL